MSDTDESIPEVSTCYKSQAMMGCQYSADWEKQKHPCNRRREKSDDRGGSNAERDGDAMQYRRDQRGRLERNRWDRRDDSES